jgi:hypothetical protein
MLGRDGVAGLVGLAGALVLLGASRGLPEPALIPIGPAFYPRIVFVATAILSALLVVQDLLRARARPGPRAASYRLVLVTYLAVAAYVGLLPLLGFRLATGLFVAGLQAALEPPRGRAWWRLLAVAVATPLLTYLVFEHYLSVLLPRGRLTGF